VLVKDEVNGITGVNSPGKSESDFEVVLDIEAVSGLFSNFEVDITVYFAPNTGQGMYNAIEVAINSGLHNSIGLSWGASEYFFQLSPFGCLVLTFYGDVEDCLTGMRNLLHYGALLGVSLFVSSGDNSASDNLLPLEVNFPASSPYAISVGGTRLVLHDKNNYNYSKATEVVWNTNYVIGTPICNGSGIEYTSYTSGTGGGYSQNFSPNSYQEDDVKGMFVFNNFICFYFLFCVLCIVFLCYFFFFI
jgi:subtilase family serine protease